MPARSNVGRWLVGTLTLVGWGVAATGPWGNDAVHVVLFHTNDLRGQSHALATPWVRPLPFAVGLTRLADRIDSERAAEPRAFVVDAGNWFRGPPGGAMEQGPGYAAALRAFDAACVEPRARSRPRSPSRMLAETGAGGRRPSGIRPRHGPPAPAVAMVERGGVRLAFAGLARGDARRHSADTRTSSRWSLPSWRDRACREIGNQADPIVPLTHLPWPKPVSWPGHDPRSRSSSPRTVTPAWSALCARARP
jgi:hypothetical protein